MSEEVANHELTFGEKAVGLTFNPGGDPTVGKIKETFARAIDLCNELRTSVGVGGHGTPEGERGRMLSIAITELQTAQMWAVKAVTWK